jgi:predicted dehydrogenase
VQNQQPTPTQDRRDFLRTATAAGLTTNLFTGRVRGANERISLAYIGMGRQGMSNLRNGLNAREEAQVVAVCDVYQPHMDAAVERVRAAGGAAKAVKDFREILADKSIDAVCVSTPDHWHAYMTVEACKAGKDVYVEKPAFTHFEEGPKMLEAARKYQRVVQGGTQQRSTPTFLKAKELVAAGALGQVTFCHAFDAGMANKAGEGKPADSEPPPGLDWDLWLGPAPKVPFNTNRWGIAPNRWSTFRYFWDYAGGEMTDWGIHLIDPMHQCLGETMPFTIAAVGSKYYVEDNLDTPDTMTAIYQYPGHLMTYELRKANPAQMFGQSRGTAIHGTEATLMVTRGGCWLTPNRGSKVEAVEFVPGAARGRGGAQGQAQAGRGTAPQNAQGQPSAHWKNFLACIRTREKPVSDIETTVRSTAVCVLGNVAMRARLRLEFDEKTFSVKPSEARPFLRANYRSPWKLEV